MSGGIIIQRRAAIKTAVNDPSIYGVLPQNCKDKVDAINAKGLDDWTDEDHTTMRDMITVSDHS